MFSEENFIMWLARIEGISLRKKEDLLSYFGSAKNVFYSDNIQLEYFCKKNKINIENLNESRNDNTLNDYVNELYKNNIDFITRESDKFPNLLKEISDVPLGLYVKGEIPENSLKKVSIVGSRKCTNYGASNAYKFAKELAENDIVVVSGMALGIDSMAHRGAIDGKGKTIAILGCGVDILYPQSNHSLRKSILENGCLLSEFPPQTPPFPANFPIRNRLISGISNSLVVVEAGKRSGTLITVNQALEQGRDVFAIPGNITSALSQGVNELLKSSAYPLTEVNDIIFSLGIVKNEICENKFDNNEVYKNLLPEEKLIYDFISSEAMSIDEIIIKTNLSVQVVQYNLTMLELKGLVQKLSGQKYVCAL